LSLHMVNSVYCTEKGYVQYFLIIE